MSNTASYIGKEPQYGVFITQTATGDGSTVAFSLDYTAATEAALIVSVGGVIQQPIVAYTLNAAGTTLTFTGAPGSSNPIWILYLGQTLTNANASSASSTLITGESAITSLAATDDFLVYDADAGALKKVQYQYVHSGVEDMAANTVKVRDANSTGAPSDKAVADTQLLIGDGTGFTAAALSGDVTMANTGAVTIAAQAVENSMLADDAVGADELAANAVVTASIVDDAVTTAKILNRNVTAAKIAEGTIGSFEIANGAIVDADISGSAAIAQSKLATIASDALSGNMIDGGTISNFASTGIDDNAASTAVTIDGSQNVAITQKVFVGGGTTSIPVSNGQQNWVQQHEASNRGGTSWFSTHNSAGGAESVFAKGRSGTLGSYTIVQDDDNLGRITWCADDGVDMNSVAAQMSVAIDGTPGANDTPGRITFATTPDGSASPTERLRIGSAGQFGIGGENYGTATQVLTSNGSAAAASWADAGGSAAASCAFRVAKSSTQSCSQNADTEISWQTSVFDVGSDFSLANNRFDCPNAGTYWFHFQVSTSFTFQNIEELCYIKKTDSSGGNVSTVTYRSDEPINDSNARGRAQGIYMEVSGTVVCAVGDRITCRFRSEGDTKTINSASQQTFFEGFQLI